MTASDALARFAEHTEHAINRRYSLEWRERRIVLALVAEVRIVRATGGIGSSVLAARAETDAALKEQTP